MLKFKISFGQSKNNSEVCSNEKNRKNEIYNLQYVSNDAGNFRRAPHCIIFKLKIYNRNLCKPQGFFYTRFLKQ